jgi:hypothetical protein
MTQAQSFIKAFGLFSALGCTAEHLKLWRFLQQPFNPKMLANPYGSQRPPDDYPRGDEAVWEHDTVIDMKGKIVQWEREEEKVLFDKFSFYRENIYELNYGSQQMYFFTFRPNKLLINRVEFGSVEVSLPETIDDFIRDCERAGIQLFWREKIAEKLRLKTK